MIEGGAYLGTYIFLLPSIRGPEPVPGPPVLYEFGTVSLASAF